MNGGDGMRIQMTSKQALIGIQTTSPQYTMRTKHPKVNLEIKEPKIEIETTKPRVEIDQTEAFADAGLKKPMRLTQDYAAESRRLMLQGIAKTANQGDELTNIHQVKDDATIASQAEYNAFGQFIYEWGYSHIPKSGPEFNPIRGEVNIRLNKGEVRSQFDRGRVESNFKRGKVETYLRQRNSLRIDVVNDSKLNIKV